LVGLSKQAKISEVGCGPGWLGNSLRENGWRNFVGVNTDRGTEITGDIRNWRNLVTEHEEFDAVIAFEVVEHINCFQELYDVLKPGGRLMLTSPVPHIGWACKILEFFGLNQKRTSPHNQLIYFNDIPIFEPIKVKNVAFKGQWEIFQKPHISPPCSSQNKLTANHSHKRPGSDFGDEPVFVT
jgi:SAM-dependent methyltransferase